MDVTAPAAIDLPFRFDDSGQVVATYDVDRQIRQRLIGIIGTNPTERVMQPDLGVGVARMVFETNPEHVVAELTVDITNQAARYEPTVAIRRIVPYPNAQKGEARLDVQYSRTDTTGRTASRFVHRAAVGSGGLIKEVRGG
ncbi:GPW/gp25 family protein [Microbispora sp. NPDC049633]|uniref:GPW/gp25 family protein n=1 Tax=Microbispora sp. NPDC049633 TaxID=3154355 RepID=UPI003435028C